jgi:pimeloyl-ACP methyl ester carboxylesterase
MGSAPWLGVGARSGRGFEGGTLMEPSRGVASPPFTEAFHPLEDGLRLAYRDYPPAAPNLPVLLRPVVCLHGLSRSCRDFEDVAPVIAALGRRVIAPSFRGRGQSSWDPKPERYNPLVYAGDIRGLLEALGVSQAVFVGTSLGGLVSMALAALDPPRVGAVVLNDVGPEINSVGLERIRGYVGRGAPVKTWEEAAARAREVNGPAFPKEAGEAFWLAFAKRTRKQEGGLIVSDYDPAIGEAARTQPVSAASLWQLFDALAAVPTLLIRGGVSDLLSTETVAAMRARKPDLTYAEVPDVGHAPMLTEPAAMTALAAFLAQVG